VRGEQRGAGGIVKLGDHQRIILPTSLRGIRSRCWPTLDCFVTLFLAMTGQGAFDKAGTCR
jgi:hypothetical protein